MQNLDQIRARNALECAKTDGALISGPNGGEVIKKLPSLILNHGLLATAAFAYSQKPGWKILFNYIARHLSDPDIGILPKGTSTHDAMMEYLSSKASSETLKLATSETFAWLTFARRFVILPKKAGQGAETQS